VGKLQHAMSAIPIVAVYCHGHVPDEREWGTGTGRVRILSDGDGGCDYLGCTPDALALALNVQMTTPDADSRVFLCLLHSLHTATAHRHPSPSP
jgi:hypothetical protein